MSWGYGLIIVGIVLLCVALYLRHRQSQGLSLMPSPIMDRVESYFEEHFRNLIVERDLITRKDFDPWQKSMTERLDMVGADIAALKEFRTSFDPRADALETRISALEKGLL